MEHEFRDGRIYFRRTEEERARLTDRLKKNDSTANSIPASRWSEMMSKSTSRTAATKEQGSGREGHDGRPAVGYPEIGGMTRCA